MKIAVACLGLLAMLAVEASAAEPATPLPWRSTGRIGFTVDAVAFPESAGTVVEVYVRVPPATLANLQRDAEGGRRLQLAARLRSEFGGNPQNATQEIRITPADSSHGFGKVVLLRFRTRTGGQRLTVRVEDPNAKKRGIAYMGRRVNEGSEVEGELMVAAPREGRSLSHLEFAWIEDSTHAPGAFARAGRRVIPNPERLYGLLATELKAFYVARGPADPRPWQARSRILDHAGRIVVQRDTTYAAAARIDGSVTEDVAREPAGGYVLEVRVWRPGDADTLLQSARWSLAWQPSSWVRSAREVEDHVHFLLDSEAEERFALMNPGEQESFLEAFWLKRDPSPGTGKNEAREEFMRRIDLANRAYGRSGPVTSGMFSDMGRVFIRYGEPSEVLKQVVPSGDNTLLQAIRDLQLTEDRDVGDVHQKGIGGDIRPYEVWIYEGEIPLPMDADPTVERSNRRRRMVFLFVDDHGTGDFRLRFSTE